MNFRLGSKLEDMLDALKVETHDVRCQILTRTYWVSKGHYFTTGESISDRIDRVRQDRLPN